MNDDSLITVKVPDNFTSESPIRAFTEFQVEGQYAVAKGFRPSIAHLAKYLSAMHSKEGWELVQIIEAANPTMIFRRVGHIAPQEFGNTPAVDLAASVQRLRERDMVFTTAPSDTPLLITVMSSGRRYVECSGMLKGGKWFIITNMDGNKITNMEPMKGEPKSWRHQSSIKLDNVKPSLKDLDKWRDDVGIALRNVAKIDDAHKVLARDYILSRRCIDLAELLTKPDEYRPAYQWAQSILNPEVTSVLDDPLNPKHYDGRECADIGERLSANAYQILKYVWRLGKKDDPCQEIGKAIWYAQSEAALIDNTKRGTTLPDVMGLKNPVAFLEDRTANQPVFTQNIARMLWQGYCKNRLQAIIEALEEHKFHLDCGRGLAI